MTVHRIELDTFTDTDSAGLPELLVKWFCECGQSGRSWEHSSDYGSARDSELRAVRACKDDATDHVDSIDTVVFESGLPV